MEGAPETPTVDALIAECQALAQHCVDTIKADPRLQVITARLEEVQAQLEVVKADAAGEAPAQDEPAPEPPA